MDGCTVKADRTAIGRRQQRVRATPHDDIAPAGGDIGTSTDGDGSRLIGIAVAVKGDGAGIGADSCGISHHNIVASLYQQALARAVERQATTQQNVTSAANHLHITGAGNSGARVQIDRLGRDFGSAARARALQQNITGCSAANHRVAQVQAVGIRTVVAAGADQCECSTLGAGFGSRDAHTHLPDGTIDDARRARDAHVARSTCDNLERAAANVFQLNTIRIAIAQRATPTGDLDVAIHASDGCGMARTAVKQDYAALI